MTTTKDKDAPSTAGGAQSDEPVELKGRLVLATGEVVSVPAEGLQVSTLHYSEQHKATVPVVSTFLVD